VCFDGRAPERAIVAPQPHGEFMRAMKRSDAKLRVQQHIPRLMPRSLSERRVKFSPKLCKAQQLCHLLYRKFLVNQKVSMDAKQSLYEQLIEEQIATAFSQSCSKKRTKKNKISNLTLQTHHKNSKLSDCKVVFFSKALNKAVQSAEATIASMSISDDRRELVKAQKQQREPKPTLKLQRSCKATFKRLHAADCCERAR
jgi:hypothetical protein